MERLNPSDPLAHYTAELNRYLAEMPEAARHEEIAEIEAHLRALAEEQMARGLSQNAALAIAIRQFGPARTVARELLDAHCRPLPPEEGTFGRALGTAALWLAAWSCVIQIGLTATMHLTGAYANAAGNTYLVLFVSAWLVGGTLLSGAMTALAAPRFAPIAVPLAILGEGVFFSLIMGQWEMLLPAAVCGVLGAMASLLFRWLVKRRFQTVVTQ